eukprot:1315882-Alexandrium_andersonii.AAC.1
MLRRLLRRYPLQSHLWLSAAMTTLCLGCCARSPLSRRARPPSVWRHACRAPPLPVRRALVVRGVARGW